MDAIGTNELRELASDRTGTCVSLYMTTHPTGTDGQQDSIRWHHLLQQAEVQLISRGMRFWEAKEFLQSVRELPHDSEFWKSRSQGLAVFVSPQHYSQFRVSQPFDELAIVNAIFHIKPLLPLLAYGQQFYILALSQNNVRLFTASRFKVEQVEVAGFPANMEEVLNYVAVDGSSQVHSGMKASKGTHRKQAAVFHGQGGQPDAHKEDLAQFFRYVNETIQPVLSKEPAPLLLAGVDYLLPIYRSVNSYSGVVERSLIGNGDYLTPSQLLERAWPLIEPVLWRARDEAAARYVDLVGTKRASDDIAQVVTAAHEGRIDALFVNPHAHEWGIFRRTDGTTIVHEARQTGDDDLLDLAAVQTLAKRGRVYAVEGRPLSRQRSVGALFRY